MAAAVVPAMTVIVSAGMPVLVLVVHAQIILNMRHAAPVAANESL